MNYIGTYWKIKIRNVNYLPDSIFHKSYKHLLFNLKKHCVDDYIYISLTYEKYGGWKEYNKHSVDWFHDYKYEYMGEFKSPKQIRKEKLNKIINI